MKYRKGSDITFRRNTQFATDMNVFAVLLSMLCISYITCSVTNSETELLDHIFTGYNPLARPVINGTTPVIVDVSMYLNSFEIAEESQELTTRGWFIFKWKNELLAWNMTEYPVSNLIVSPSMVWLPSLTIFNSNDDRNAIIRSISGVKLSPDGTISWSPDVSMKTSCPISVMKYPFDKQNCDINVIAWLRRSSEQEFRSVYNKISVVSDELNTEWEYLGSSIKVETIIYADLSSVEFNIEVKRRPFYQIVHTLIPIVLLSYMNCFIFIIPINSGENTSFGVAIFLAFAVFIGPVKESLPVTSTETCILTVYMIAQFCVGGLETCLSCITLRLASRTTPVKTNSWWNTLINITFRQKQGGLKVSPEQISSDAQIIKVKSSKESDEIGVTKPQGISTSEQPQGDVDIDWVTLSSKLNTALFFLCILVKTVLLMVYLVSTV
ncbi:acetylcholine receptor subunit beta-type acr-3-like [Argopecten irradians]|uniref:acetylcholine receptor subunit beta-type acr-3-like n=1 Tax=Argopecten irradians TaxID=31199 RepID=UPI0037226C69